jgi:hypothetical protein
MVHNEEGELDRAKKLLDHMRADVEDAEKLLRSAKKAYAIAWKRYEDVAPVTEITVKAVSHLLEGEMTMERRARFCDITGEEIAPGTGAKLVLTQGNKRWEADVADSALPSLLDTLNNPEEKKKRGRPVEGASESADAAKEPVAAAAK